MTKYEINWMDWDTKILCPDQMKECRGTCPKAVRDMDKDKFACGFAVSTLCGLENKQRDDERIKYSNELDKFHKESREKEWERSQKASKYNIERNKLHDERYEERQERDDENKIRSDAMDTIDKIKNALHKHTKEIYEEVFDKILEKMYDETGKHKKVKDMTFEEYGKENKK